MLEKNKNSPPAMKRCKRRVSSRKELSNILGEGFILGNVILNVEKQENPLEYVKSVLVYFEKEGYKTNCTAITDHKSTNIIGYNVLFTEDSNRKSCTGGSR